MTNILKCFAAFHFMLNVKTVLFAVRTVERSDGVLLVVKNEKVNKGQIYPIILFIVYT